MIDVIQSTMLGLSAGLLYGTLWYARAYRANGERFNPAKFTGTLIVSGCIGAGFGLSGIEVTEETVIAAIAANTAVIALLEPILKSIFSEVGWFPNYAGSE